MDSAVSDLQHRDQNYQNPLGLLNDNAFVTALLILLFVAILEIVIGFFYSTYCSYPSVMRSDASRQRVQYCAMAGGLGQCEQTVFDHTVKSQDEDVKMVRKIEVLREEVIVEMPGQSSPNRTRRNSVDIQSVLSSILSDCEDDNDAVSVTSNDDSLFAEEGLVGSDVKNVFTFDKNDKSGKGVKTFQHTRVLTQGSAGGGSRSHSKKLDTDKTKYSIV
jgi:hypothetical protein